MGKHFIFEIANKESLDSTHKISFKRSLPILIYPFIHFLFFIIVLFFDSSYELREIALKTLIFGLAALILGLPYGYLMFQYVLNDWNQIVTINKEEIQIQKAAKNKRLNIKNGIKQINYVKQSSNLSNPLDVFSFIEIVTKEDEIYTITCMSSNFKKITQRRNLRVLHTTAAYPKIRKKIETEHGGMFDPLINYYHKRKQKESINQQTYFYDKFKNKKNENLLSTIESPDFSDEAKHAAKAILKERGIDYE